MPRYRIVANSHKNEIKIIEFERALGWRLRRAELLLRYSGLLSSYMGDDIYSAACIVDTAAAKEREREGGRPISRDQNVNEEGREFRSFLPRRNFIRYLQLVKATLLR